MFLNNKLYFKCKKDRLKLPKDDNKEYISVSSNKGDE